MNFRLLVLILSFLPVCFAEEYPPPVYPTAESGEEFQKQAEAFVIAVAVHMPERDIKEKLRNDTRDWESALEKLIREPSIDPIAVSGVAFDYSAIRGTSKNPKIVAATEKWFNRHIQAALERYESYTSQGKPQHSGITGSFPNATYRILNSGAPDNLTHVLDYLNSPDDEKIRLIDRNTPNEVATALRSYGDESHIDAAKKFARRLRDVGKDEIANDIDRSVERIQKDGKRAKTTTQRDLASTKTNQPGQEDDSTSAEEKRGPSLPWIIGGIAAVVAVAGMIAASRRAK